MGKKTKIGKSRRDKAYWSAKEIGFRSRASFKLVQLNRKFEFLQKARVCLDLCAAPGSWMQVAKETMPLSSVIIGVDLVPIKPIQGAISMVNDITTDKCRQDIRKELQGWKADVVLHDGAPNVGKSWIHDAYQQSLLVLSSFKLATEFLKPNGTFVTKVFRSKDYQSLIWVFNQFFKKVHSTKPPASRNESAEIFVVCLGYKAPDKIDPRFLDPSSVFSEVKAEEDDAKVPELVNPEKKKKAPAEGYDDDATILYKKIGAMEFIKGDKPIHILNNYNEIILDTLFVKNHAKTTKEIKECLKDIKVLGIKDLRVLKKWREALKEEIVNLENKKIIKKMTTSDNGEDEMEVDEDDEDLKKIEEEIQNLNEEDRKMARRAKKKLLKEKRKRAEKIDLKMVIPGDCGPTKEEHGLFSLRSLHSQKDLEAIEEGDSDLSEESDEDDSAPKPKKLVYSREKGVLDKSGLYYKNEDDVKSDENSEEDSDDQDELGLNEPSLKMISNEEADKLVAPPTNPLLLDLDSTDRDSRREKKSKLWFDKDIFKSLEEDNEDLEDADIANAIKALKNKGSTIVSETKKKQTISKKCSEEEEIEENEDSSSSSSEDSDYEFDSVPKEQNEESGFQIVPQRKPVKRPRLTPEELALGQEMIKSKKAKRDIIDEGWNRFMFPDKDSDLPDWFVKEERYHMRKVPDVDQAALAYYEDAQKGVDVKTIKKVVEAKARKKRRLTKKLDKAKKKAAAILENDDKGSREKAREIEKMYKKIHNSKDKKKEVVYTVAKKAFASKKVKKPAGGKAFYKSVDPRMKKDNATKRSNSSGKRVKKRRLKGKKAKPTV